MKGPIHTRPERTPVEIEADAFEGEKFFATVYTGFVGRRDLQRMLRFHAYAENLVQCCIEGGGAWHIVQVSTPERRRRADIRDSRTIPNPTAFATYVEPSTRALLPEPRLHPRNKEECRNESCRRQTWIHRWERAAAAQIALLIERDRVGYARWACSVSNDRPKMRQVVDPSVKPRFVPGTYRKGQIRPAGISPERAMQIAERVLANRPTR